MANVEYPAWKKVAWRFGRVFGISFVMTIASFMIDLKEIPTLDSLYTLAIVPAYIGGFAALGKAIREYFEDGEMRKLPF